MFSSRAVRHQGTNRRSVAVALATAFVVSALGTASPQVASAAEVQARPAVADASAFRSTPNATYASKPRLAAKRSQAQFFVMFDLSPWYGKAIERIELELTVVEGNAAALRFRRSGTELVESRLTWRSRPRVASKPVVKSATSGKGSHRVDLAKLFPTGTVDRRILVLQGKSAVSRIVRVASRESGSGPAVRFTERSTTGSSGSPGGTAQSPPHSDPPQSDPPLRFYTPNIITPGDHETPARDTDPAQIAALFARESDMAPLLRQVDAYGFFGGTVTSADERYRAMLRRAIPMLKKYGVDIALEVAGPMGYAPGIVSGADVGGENGADSARFDLTERVARVEALGGSVRYLMLDGPLRRTIQNGIHRTPHVAYVTIGTAIAGNAITYRARAAGFAGNSIRVQYLAEPNKPLSVSVSGNDVTVRLRTDSLGRSLSTAADVAAAVKSSAAAMALVSVELHGASSSGTVPQRGWTSLAWGDDGLNFSIKAACAELVAYMATIHADRPRIEFILLEDVVLWPYDGKPGYASVPYPTAQRPDFMLVWDELVRQLRGAGLLDELVGMHNDASVEYFDSQITSLNKSADDWYGRVLKQQAQVESAGVAFGQHFNSVYGGNPRFSDRASARYFQERVLHHVRTLETYRLANRPALDQMDHFTLDAFMYYPRTITPYTVEYSTDDTYLDALALFNQYR